MISEAKRKAIIARYGEAITRRIKIVFPYNARDYGQYMTSLGAFLDFLVEADPSSNSRYVEWLAKRFAAGDFVQLEDVMKYGGYIQMYRNALPRLPIEERDLNKLTCDTLWPIVKRIMLQGLDVSKAAEDRAKEAKMIADGDAIIYYNSDDIKIVIPKTEEASCHFGRHTQWCTAATYDNRFESYSVKGDLYIILFKKTNVRWQFHFEEGMCMDEEDEFLSARQMRKVAHLFPDEKWARAFEYDNEEMFLEVMKDPWKIGKRLAEISYSAFRYVRRKDQTEEMREEAVGEYVENIRYVGKPSWRVLKSAIHHWGVYIIPYLQKKKWFTPKWEHRIRTLSAYAQSIQVANKEHYPEPTQRQLNLAVINRPELLKEHHQSFPQFIRKLVAKNHPTYAAFYYNDDPEIRWLAVVNSRGNAVANLGPQTPEEQNYIIDHAIGHNLRYCDPPMTVEMAERVIKRFGNDGIRYVSKATRLDLLKKLPHLAVEIHDFLRVEIQYLKKHQPKIWANVRYDRSSFQEIPMIRFGSHSEQVEEITADMEFLEQSKPPTRIDPDVRFVMRNYIPNTMYPDMRIVSLGDMHTLDASRLFPHQQDLAERITNAGREAITMSWERYRRMIETPFRDTDSITFTMSANYGDIKVTDEE